MGANYRNLMAGTAGLRAICSPAWRRTGRGGRRFQYAYRFDIESERSQPVAVEVVDQIPVLELEQVQVKVGPETTAGFDLDRDTGMVRWKMPLRAKEKRSFELAFHVDVQGAEERGF
jgi:hypothetical protein